MYVQPVSVLRARQQAAAIVVCVLRKHIGVHLGRQCVPKQVICHAVAEAVVGYAYQLIVIICVADLRVTLRKAGKPVHGVVAVCSHVAVGVGHACAQTLIGIVAVAYRFASCVGHRGYKAAYACVGCGCLYVFRIAARTRGEGITLAVVSEGVLHAGFAYGGQKVVLGIVGIIKLVALGVGSLYQVIGTVVFERAVLFGKPLYAYNIAVVIICVALAELFLKYLHAVKVGVVAVVVIFKAEHYGRVVKRRYCRTADILPFAVVRVKAYLVILCFACPYKAQPQFALAVVDFAACACILRECGYGVHLRPSAEGITVAR